MGKYYSQHGEDALLDMIFGDQASGFFLEVGCIDGKCFSNTLTFEERGWKGMCVEAHAGYIELLRKNRPNSIVCHCAAGEADEDAVFYANARGSLSSLDKTTEGRWKRDYAPYFSGFEEQQVKKMRLSSLLDAYQVSEVDILSLDIEGYEVEAMKGLDLSRHRPKVMVIESDSARHEKQLDQLILKHGYQKSIKWAANLFYVRDGWMHDKLINRRFKAYLHHTRHPLDGIGEWVEEVTLETGVAPLPLFPRIKSKLSTVMRKASSAAGIGQPKRLLSQFMETGFHGDEYLLALANHLASNSKVFVETGANVGSTLAYVARNYPVLRCFSCEPDHPAFAEASKNTGRYGNASLFRGTSQQFIDYLARNEAWIFNEPTLFWLDEWPLKDELQFITRNFKSGFILIDDFKVPGRDQFGYDEYGEQICSFDYVKGALNPQLRYRLYYPTYQDRTSKYHPLRGWGLLAFGHEGFSPPEQLTAKMEEVSC